MGARGRGLLEGRSRGLVLVERLEGRAGVLVLVGRLKMGTYIDVLKSVCITVRVRVRVIYI